jgi:hypothetical protein
MLTFNNVFALLSVVGLMACAATPSSSEDSTSGEALSASRTTFVAFKKDVLDEAQRFADEEDCAVEAKESSSGLTLSISENGRPVKLTIPSNAKITLSIKKEQKVYEIEHVGSVTILNADDAFMTFGVASTSPKGSATCEIDF